MKSYDTGRNEDPEVYHGQTRPCRFYFFRSKYPMKSKVIALGVVITSTLAAVTPDRSQHQDLSKQEETVASNPEAELKAAKEELATMLKRFGEENPKVIAQRRKIADLERQLAPKSELNQEKEPKAPSGRNSS